MITEWQLRYVLIVTSIIKPITRPLKRQYTKATSVRHSMEQRHAANKQIQYLFLGKWRLPIRCQIMFLTLDRDYWGKCLCYDILDFSNAIWENVLIFEEKLEPSISLFWMHYWCNECIQILPNYSFYLYLVCRGDTGFFNFPLLSGTQNVIIVTMCVSFVNIVTGYWP